LKKIALLTYVCLSVGLLAHAQATRTWVSGVGDDVNPCSRTAPCKTFAGAISKTAAGGEIDALDPGGYGTLTVTKSITIDGGAGQVGSVLASGTNGIVVAAGANDVVTLRNLTINGTGSSVTPGVNGVRWLSGKVLHIENCHIFGFATNGIDIVKSDGGTAFVRNTTVADNAQFGIAVQSSVLVTSVSVSGSSFDSSSYGVVAGSFSKITVTNSSATGNSGAGFVASNATGTAELDVSNSMADNNGAGVQAGGNGGVATVRASSVSMFGNSIGFNIGPGGTLKSFGNNANINGGAVTAPSLPLQ
jgi:hypothetical protein